MKTIGMLGGMSWESTLIYYKAINEEVKKQLGGLNSAKIILYSVNFQEIEKLQMNGEWEKAGAILAKASQKIEAGGADFLIICTNTMHKVAPKIETGIKIPIIHIADATAEQMLHDGIKKVGLLGTAFTMEQEFYKNRIQDKHGIDVLIPNMIDREFVHNVIFDELCPGDIKESSRQEYLRIISELSSRGAEAVILGCTEIAMLISADHMSIKLYDTTQIHAKKAVSTALS